MLKQTAWVNRLKDKLVELAFHYESLISVLAFLANTDIDILLLHELFACSWSLTQWKET